MSEAKPNAFKTIIRRLSRRTSTKLLLPEDQLEKLETIEKLRDKEKKNPNDVITKYLTHKDPQSGKNSVFFHHLEGVWKEKENEDCFIHIYSRDTNYFYKDDKAAEAQHEYHKYKLELKQAAKAAGKQFDEKESDSVKSLRNQLSYAERTSQTINPEIKHRNIQTAKLERNKFSGMLNKWDIFDRYVDVYILEEERKKREDNLLNAGNKKQEKKKNNQDEVSAENLSKPSLLKVLKLIERQVLQTLNFISFFNYREWEKKDNTNEDNKLMMLLPFPHSATIRNRSVTAIVWNKKYDDLFAIGYGNYKFPTKQEGTKEGAEERSDDSLEPGLIFIFSIKNNYYPEIKYTTESGVLSLDFHSVEHSFLVVGMYDGTVSVYDIKLKTKLPIIVSDIRYQKHMDPVWQVKWYNTPDTFVFFSISTDGKIFKWSFLKNKNSFEQEEILVLKYTDSQNELANQGVDIDSKEKGEENLIFGNSGGMCIDFNPHPGYKHFFICGTEEGHIQLCSVNHRGHYMQNYEGHTMGVYTLAWNPYHEKIFASCSADWTIKIWHYKIFHPLIIFDIQNAVGDIAWSPWCSTIFAAVTVNGDMKFFDLNVNRKSYIYEKNMEILLLIIYHLITLSLYF